ncbi:hypothetical protein PR048_021333 [Dryococelus australis]|uniref:Uncharacterized protein n=1 Tax=Dryococelus australis TaxID=614101 RepID=A0ABQ9GY02_9NEOP|nr:hypothetical protein PR048_021333 [Dryococelus australis]
MRVIEVSLEQLNGIVRHYSHLRAPPGFLELKRFLTAEVPAHRGFQSQLVSCCTTGIILPRIDDENDARTLESSDDVLREVPSASPHLLGPLPRRQKTSLPVLCWPISIALFNIVSTVYWPVEGVSATVFRKVLLQSRLCPGSIFEGAIRQAVELRVYNGNIILCNLALIACVYSNHRDSGASKGKKTAIVIKMAGFMGLSHVVDFFFNVQAVIAAAIIKEQYHTNSGQRMDIIRWGLSSSVDREISSGATVTQWIERFQVGARSGSVDKIDVTLTSLDCNPEPLGPKTEAAATLVNKRYDGYTARLARKSDEALGVRVNVARIAPSLLDLAGAVACGRAVPDRLHPVAAQVNIVSDKVKVIGWLVVQLGEGRRDSSACVAVESERTTATRGNSIPLAACASACKIFRLNFKRLLPDTSPHGSINATTRITRESHTPTNTARHNIHIFNVCLLAEAAGLASRLPGADWRSALNVGVQRGHFGGAYGWSSRSFRTEGLAGRDAWKARVLRNTLRRRDGLSPCKGRGDAASAARPTGSATSTAELIDRELEGVARCDRSVAVGSPIKPADQQNRPARFPLAKSGDPAGDLTRFAMVGGQRANRLATMAAAALVDVAPLGSAVVLRWGCVGEGVYSEACSRLVRKPGFADNLSLDRFTIPLQALSRAVRSEEQREVLSDVYPGRGLSSN